MNELQIIEKLIKEAEIDREFLQKKFIEADKKYKALLHAKNVLTNNL